MNKKIRNILRKKNKSKITSLTAYSKNIAKILDKHCDIVLVGDSLANVLYGFENTHKINLENIIQHTQSVKKGVNKSLLVVDMPKGSYPNPKTAEKNAFFKKVWDSQKKFADTAVPFWSGAQMSNAQLGMAHAATLK